MATSSARAHLINIHDVRPP